MIELKEGNYFYAFFFVASMKEDLMGAIWKEEKEPGKIFLEYRFRYYKDDKTFDSKDEKNWYSLVGKQENFERLMEITKFICDSYAVGKGAVIKDFILVNGDHEVLAEILKTKKWADMKFETEH